MRLAAITYALATRALDLWGLDVPTPSLTHTYLGAFHEDSELYGVAAFEPVEGAGYLEFKSFWVKPNTEPQYIIPVFYEIDCMDVATREAPNFNPPSF